MALPTEPTHQNRHQTNQIPNILHSATSNLQSIFNFNSNSNSIIKPTPYCSARVCFPLMYPDSPKPLAFKSIQPDSGPKTDARNISSPSESNKGFPSTVRIGRVNSNSNGGGPAFVGQVFSMCDLSGTGLMAVSTHFDIPFISKRTPEWLKKIFATITKSERNGPVFRFFMDLGDAVAYVKRLNIPSGVVGACRLDLAYEHFKEKPHLFQFVPNEKQVKAANKLLKTIPQESGCKKVDGVPVFSAQNLDIAISTTDGIKWYTPYFFDKNMLDNILEESVDQHFHELIQTRYLQRRREVVDDNMAAEVMEEIGDSLWEPPEVQEMMDEMGHPGIPLSVVSKAAEMQLLYAVDKVLLGNRWLRKATGIQPKFPYIVDSFEKRSAASFQRIYESTTCLPNSETGHDTRDILYHDASEPKPEDDSQTIEENGLDFRLPFGNWFRHQFSKQKHNNKSASKGCTNKNTQQSLMPKVTMVGISTSEGGQMSKASLKKTMEDLTKELEQIDHEDATRISNGNDEFRPEKDPLFVANVADYHSGMSKRGSARLVRSESN